jgi:hypothetical protein
MYPYVPARVKVAIYPYVVLVLVGLFVADDWGLVDLAAASPPTAEAAEGAIRRGLAPSRTARADIPPRYLALYKQAGQHHAIPWTVLAGIGKVESDHGRSRAPGVRSGVNRFGCCAGPMQFNLRNGPPSTWATYGHGSPYRPSDAIPAAARLLVANGARRNLDQAIYSYNHSWPYVAQVKALAATYQKGA